MDIVTRDALRTAVIEKLLADFPKAQKVQGGVAFISETMDEETGLYFPVEIKVAVNKVTKENLPTLSTRFYIVFILLIIFNLYTL